MLFLKDKFQYVFFVLLAAGFIGAQSVFYDVGLSSHTYAPAANISLSGKLLNGTSLAPDGTIVNFTITNGSYSSTYSTNTSGGLFSKVLVAPNGIGNYNLTLASSGNASLILGLEVSTLSDIYLSIVNTTIFVPLSSSTLGITADSSVTGSKKYANFTFQSTTYFVIVENTSTIFDKVYVDDDNNLNFSDSSDNVPPSKYLQKDSQLTLGSKSFFVHFISPYGSVLVLAERVTPIFNGTGNETYNILALTLDSNGEITPSVPLNFTFTDASGNVESNYAGGLNGTSSSYGNFTVQVNASSSGGLHHIVANDRDHISTFVQKFTLKADILDAEGNPAAIATPSSPLTLRLSVLNSSGSISAANVTARIFTPSTTSTSSLTFVSNLSQYNGSYVPTEVGEYSVEFQASFAGTNQTLRLQFQVRNYQFFIFPVSTQKGQSDGFAPRDQGAIFVSGRTLSDGSFANLTSLTNNCNASLVKLVGMFDSSGLNKFNGTYTVLLFSSFISSVSLPSFVQDEIKTQFGENPCVIKFTAPEKVGVYDVQVNVNISGTDNELHSSVGVQDIFVHASPVGSSGEFSFAITPGSRVYLSINAYDPVTGSQISPSKILSASLVEVFSQSGGAVTHKMLNESFSTTSRGATLSFVANDSTTGFHFVKFRLSANVTRSGSEVTTEAVGEGWFQEKLYQIFAYPAGGKFGFKPFGSDNSTAKNITVEVYDGSGRNPKQSVKVDLSKVRNFQAFSDVSTATASRCTTNANGTCTLSITKTDGPWQSGGYDVEVKATDENDISDFGHAFFEIRNFNFWAYTTNWEVSTSQSINFSVSLSEFSGSPVSANVSFSKLMYMGSFDSWQPPSIVNQSISSNAQISGSGTITLPAGSISKTGQYMAILTARTNDGRIETSQAWFSARPFTLFSEGVGQNFERRYGTSDLVTINMTGFDSINWNTYPPSGTPHNITAAWVQKVEKMGKWGVDYKTRSDMQAQNNMTSTCSGNNCLLSFNLSSFEQGEYNIVVKANDSSGSVAESWFFFRVEQLRIAVPELMNWYRAKETSTTTNATSFTLTKACGTQDDEPTEPTNVTNCAYGDVSLLNYFGEFTQYGATNFLLDKNSTKLYVNFNSTFTGVANYSVGQVFKDNRNNSWLITQIDNVSAKVFVQLVNGTIGFTNVNDKDNSKISYKINASLSKSGKFLIADFKFFEEQYRNVDLNGDGDYNDNYYILVADTATAGIYNVVLMSNTTDFLAYSAASTDANGFKFSENAKAIFLTNLKLERGSGSSSNSYEMTFTSNVPGWQGTELGTYKSNTIVKVPIIVTQPSNKSLSIVNATVSISAVKSFGRFASTSFTALGTVVKNTSSSGLAILDLNTSNLPSGRYFLEISVLPPGSSTPVVAGNEWENPKVEIRNFEVRGELGSRGQISGLREISVAANNLFEYEASEQAMQGGSPISNIGSGIYRADFFEFQQFYYNSTSGLVIIDSNGDGNLASEATYNYSSQLIPVPGRAGAVLFLNITSLNLVPYNITVPRSGVNVTERGFIISVNNVSNQLSFTHAAFNYQVTQSIFIGSGFGPFQVVAENGTQVTLSWMSSAFTYNSPYNFALQGQPRLRVLSVNSQTQLLMLNSPLNTTEADLFGWSGQVDNIYLVNKTNGAILPGGPYAIGQNISTIGRAIIKADLFDAKVLATNFTLNGQYPVFPYYCDFAKFYVANFTERSTGMKIIQSYSMGGYGSEQITLDNTTTFYMVAYDNNCDGGYAVDQVQVDDDLNFNNGRNNINFTAWDYDRAEYVGNKTLSYDGSEQWISIGQWGWPFQVTAVNVTSGIADLFAAKYGSVRSNENLTLWVTAKYFDGLNVNGIINLTRIDGYTFSHFGSQEVSVNVSSFGSGTSTVSSGNGFLLLTIGNLSSGDYNLKVQVKESLNNETELLEVSLYVFEESKFCGGPCDIFGGSGSGGMGGGMGGNGSGNFSGNFTNGTGSGANFTFMPLTFFGNYVNLTQNTTLQHNFSLVNVGASPINVSLFLEQSIAGLGMLIAPPFVTLANPGDVFNFTLVFNATSKPVAVHSLNVTGNDTNVGLRKYPVFVNVTG